MDPSATTVVVGSWAATDAVVVVVEPDEAAREAVPWSPQPTTTTIEATTAAIQSPQYRRLTERRGGDVIRG
jgi:hypothetical protein